MTKYSYETAYKLFSKHGYSLTCEFVRISDAKKGKFLARCKTCGHEFERDTNVLRKPQKTFRCPKCHDRLIASMLEYYKAGHSADECADKYGLKRYQVYNYAKQHGVHGGMSKEQVGEFAKAAQRKAIAKSAEIRRKQLEDKTRLNRVESEFKKIEKDISKWHKSLIAIFNDETSRSVKETNRLNEWISLERNCYKSSLADYEPQIATCKHCGKQWIFWPSRERYGRKKPSVYCSKSCNNKHAKKAAYAKHGSDNTGHRLRRHGLGAAPRDSIPLDEVIRRDNGICYICGCKVSKEDSWRDEHGYFVCGPTYPTRDHVMPISKGGTHTWDNVRLACHRCNSLKGAKVQGALKS